VKKHKKNKTVPLTKEAALKNLGARIKELRIKKGHTSYEYFAYENDISRSQFGKYEKGSDIRFSTLVKIINGLEISLEEFFKGM
jgi:transcriptional regulator with XRE-family HTH domain